MAQPRLREFALFAAPQWFPASWFGWHCRLRRKIRRSISVYRRTLVLQAILPLRRGRRTAVFAWWPVRASFAAISSGSVEFSSSRENSSLKLTRLPTSEAGLTTSFKRLSGGVRLLFNASWPQSSSALVVQKDILPGRCGCRTRLLAVHRKRKAKHDWQNGNFHLAENSPLTENATDSGSCRPASNKIRPGLRRACSRANT